MPNVDLTEWRTVLVTGTDAVEWLDDLVSAGLSGEDSPRRSLLLTPTGRIRADFHVVPTDGARLLIQDPIQPTAIDDLLARYVLSSDVSLERVEAPQVAEWTDEVLHPAEAADGMSIEEFDEWRTHEGIPRFGVDMDEDSLPQEAGWERFIDFTKGCFMGQEAMAKIRNMGGHPTRVVNALMAEEPVAAGTQLQNNAGLVTSAAGTDVIARVQWNARDGELFTESGVRLLDRG